MIDSYNKLMLGKYREILAINADESTDALDRQVQTLSILSGLAEEEVLHLPLAEYKEMVVKSKFLEQTKIPVRQMAKKYVVGKFELIPVSDYRKLETGQYIDFNTYSSDLDKNTIELLSVILVPKGHRYNEGYDLLEVQQAIREDMSVADGVTVIGFFLTLCRKSILDSLNYSRREAKKIKDKEKREMILKKIQREEMILKSGGDGLQI